MEKFTCHIGSLDDSESFACCLSRLLVAVWKNETNVTLALTGTLGAGKTTLVRLLCTSLGIPENEVSSPSYAIQNVYHAKHPAIEVNHFDFYRLKDEDELFEIGFEETISQPGIHVVEWANRFESFLPHDRLTIDIHHGDQVGRVFDVCSSLAEELSDFRDCLAEKRLTTEQYGS